jgi:hypothetical protein
MTSPNVGLLSPHAAWVQGVDATPRDGVVSMPGPRTTKETQRRFWKLIGEGCPTERAAIEVGVSAMTGKNWFRDGGGMAPMTLTEPSSRYLTRPAGGHRPVLGRGLE